MSYQQIYVADQFADIISANSSAPAWLDQDGVTDRILEYARSRAHSRGEDSALDGDGTECFITTNWSAFTDDWGFSGGSANQVAIGTLNEKASAAKQATLFEDVVILQTDWLRDGDGRKTQAETYIDSGWEDASRGDMWVPDNAQEYLCITELTGEVLHGEPTLTDAM